ncbi:cation:proton antiporter [Pseudonocardia nantongensis]|uniref:cation:proton antiporter n=1 Tax=Pseudonocardia nantongensis TaxID=1181885 RepID=UPI00397B7003
MISTVLDVLGGLLLLVGLSLMTIGLVGVLRLEDTHDQLHAQGLATGPGIIAVLASSIATENAAIITFAGLAIAFIVLSSPAASHAIARVARDRRRSPGSDG